MLLSPLLALLAAAILPTQDEPAHEENPNLIPPDHEPSLAEIEDFSQRKRRPRKHLPEDADLLLRYIPPEDRSRILLCGKAVLRFADPRSGMDLLTLRRCHNYYCPWCPASSHLKRTQYQSAKLASLSPTRELRVINVVWTLPEPLQPVVRFDPRGNKAFTAAVRSTIARAYHYRGAKGVKIDSAAWNELGAIRNLHAIGDRAEPWPKWAPHYDMLLAAYRRRGDKILEMPAKWPELYEHTSHTYRRELRDAFLPIAQALGDRALVEFLRTDFAVDWHVSPADGHDVVHIEKALHRVRYSCRPLFSLGQCSIDKDGSNETLLYDTHPNPDRNELTHRVPPGPAFGQIASLREWLDGRKTRGHMGILSKRSYADAARLAGNEPVEERVKRGLQLKAAWLLQPDGSFEKLQDPRMVA